MTETAPHRVLIVEDDPLSRRVLASILEPDCVVVMASNGRQALDRAAAPPQPDLVLLDLVLPDMDGYEILKRLREAPATATIPIVVVSALSGPGDEIKGLDLGAIDYIAKPYHPALVKARVNNHLALAAARQQLERQNQALQEAIRVRDDVYHILRHDLKSPVATIASIAQYVADGEGDEISRKEMISGIITVSQKMLSMLDRYLMLSSIEQGRYEMDRRPVDITATLYDAAREIEPMFRGKNLSFRLVSDRMIANAPAPVVVNSDATLMSALFSNLIKNAYEASPNGQEIQATITTAKQMAISIRNLGEVPLAIRHRFFEKYNTSGKHGGTGLGCYSAKLIAKVLGGDIELDTSEPDATTLTVVLPAGA